MLRGFFQHRSDYSQHARSVRAQRPGGIKRKLLVCLALLMILVALLPTIIAKTPLHNVLLSKALPSDAIRVSLSDLSLGWMSGPSLTGLQVTDAAGNPLIVAESVSVDRTPLNLIANSRDLGAIQINRPAVYLKLRPDGSNLEDALRQLLADVAKSSKPAAENVNESSAPLAFAIQLVDGTVVAEDTATGRVWRIDGVNVQYDCHGAAGGIGNGSAAGQISSAERGAPLQPAGRFALTIKPNGARNELALQADGIAVALAQPYLARFANITELSGTAAATAAASWSTANPLIDLNTTGTVTIDKLDAAGPQLAGDRLRLARVELPWQVASQPNGLAIQNLALKSDVGSMAIRGRLDPALLSGASMQTAALPVGAGNDIELAGAVDLARLAAMLPHALGIRSDTTITSGSVQLAARVQPTAAGQAITGSVRTAQLAATNQGKPFTWDDPITANFAARREGGQLAVDTLDCNSKFLRVQAAGTQQQLTGSAEFDLNALAQQLGQFIDLSRTQLAGTGTAKFGWQTPTPDKFIAKATADLTQLRVTLSDGAVWSEPQLGLTADAAGQIDPASHQPVRVDSAQLQVAGGGDLLDARLAGPVQLAGGNTAAVWPVTVRSTGSLARWLTRARPWFAPGDWRVDGASEITANVRASSTAIDVTDANVTINNLQAANADWNINEPVAKFAGDAHVNLATGEFAANSAQFVTSTVSLATQGVHYAAAPNGIGQLAGAAAFRADLARLAAWRAPTNPPSPYRPKGEFTGNLRFAQQAGRITGELTATGQNLVLESTASRGVPAPVSPANTPQPPAQTIWQEPRLTLHGTTNYDAASDRVLFDNFQIQSNTLQANIAGAVEKLSTEASCNITGSLNYDLAQLSPLLRPYIGEGIQLNGREQARFAVAGNLLDAGTLQAQQVAYSVSPQPRAPSSQSWSRRIRAQLDLPWSGANVYGLPVGGGKLSAQLGNGSLQIAPLTLAVGEGRLNLAPNVRFDPEPAELSMPAGPVITNVRISPEVSETLLKYMAPVLAGATQSEGQFSLALDGLRTPLADSKKTDAGGKFTVHSVRVTPGPMTQQWVGLAQQIETLVKRRDPASAGRNPVTLLSIRDQQVNFRVVNGRVYHEAMEFQCGDVVMRSGGSVGLDETLQLTLQIPIQDAWIAKEPLLGGLKGQSLSVPVGGTLKRPQIDQRAIANLSGQLIQNAATGAVNNELNKALDKFLKPKK